MSNDKMGWVDQQQELNEAMQSDGYFSIAEGDNRIQMLTHCARLAQKWNPGLGRYEIAHDNDRSASIKGICWVLHDGKIKQAKLPYTVVKAVRDLQNDPDYAFESFPMPRYINIKTKNAKTKEVEYSIIPAPRETDVPQAVLEELAKKPTPEECVEKIKAKSFPADYAVEEVDEGILTE